jgi:hypothetical protein
MKAAKVSGRAQYDDRAPDHAHDRAALGPEELMRAVAGAGAGTPKLETGRRRRLDAA